MKGLFALFLVGGAVTTSFGQVVAGQIDTFPTDIMGWSGAAPTWLAGGGPDGAADNCLSLASTGGQGQGGRMACFNGAQWSGNYTGAGVVAIDVDFKNLGATDLEMRLVLFDLTISTQWVSNDSKILLAGSGWQHATFSLSGAFTQFDGATSFADTLANVNRMMFRHNPGVPDHGGVPIVANLAVDNIRATPVPEPVSVFVLGGASLLFLGRRLRK